MTEQTTDNASQLTSMFIDSFSRLVMAGVPKEHAQHHALALVMLSIQQPPQPPPQQNMGWPVVYMR